MKEVAQVEGQDIQILTDNLHRIKGYPKLFKIPETFEELKELCGKFDNVEIRDKHIQFKWHLTLFDSGAVLIDTRVVAFRRTPEQMWAIFKNLMEI